MTTTTNTTNQAVNFTVIELADAEGKENTKRVTIEWSNGNTETYERKVLPGSAILVAGCRIAFNKDNTVKYVKRSYDVKGKKVMSTKSKAAKGNVVASIVEQKPVEVEVNGDGNIKHARYAEIKMCLECNIPVYLAGPAGSGKNYTVEQICDELGWGFYFSNSVQQEYKLTGFIDAGGEYHDTEFYKACTDEQPCVFFLDEMDASIPEVLVLLNAAIANGYFEFPTGRVGLENVHFVAAGNTVGSGADEQYTGRMVLDQATLDRFAIIGFDYDTNVELHIANNNATLVGFIHELRADAEMKGIRATFSYRCIAMVTKLEAAGMPLEKVIEIAVVKGLDKDTINTLYTPATNKYGKALAAIKQAA